MRCINELTTKLTKDVLDYLGVEYVTYTATSDAEGTTTMAVLRMFDFDRVIDGVIKAIVPPDDTGSLLELRRWVEITFRGTTFGEFLRQAELDEATDEASKRG